MCYFIKKYVNSDKLIQFNSILTYQINNPEEKNLLVFLYLFSCFLYESVHNYIETALLTLKQRVQFLFNYIKNITQPINSDRVVSWLQLEASEPK